MYSFTCERCGKTVSCKSDPSKWRQRICMDCRNASGEATKTTTQRYTPPAKTFDLMTYVSEMVVIYKTIKSVCEEEGVDLPEANIAQWTTSIMIQKDKC